MLALTIFLNLKKPLGRIMFLGYKIHGSYSELRRKSCKNRSLNWKDSRMLILSRHNTKISHTQLAHHPKRDFFISHCHKPFVISTPKIQYSSGIKRDSKSLLMYAIKLRTQVNFAASKIISSSFLLHMRCFTIFFYSPYKFFPSYCVTQM